MKSIEKDSGEKDSLELLKQKEIFDQLFNERRFELNKLSEGIDFNNLTYQYKGKSAPKYVICFEGPLTIYNDVKNGRITLRKEEKIQEEFQLELNEILNPDYKSENQRSAIKKYKKLYNGWEIIIESYLRLNTKQRREKGSKH